MWMLGHVSQSQPFVSIAVVEGLAVAGGFEWALACDVRLVGPNARFWLPETKLGLIPAAGGCTRLTDLVGASKAKQARRTSRLLARPPVQRPRRVFITFHCAGWIRLSLPLIAFHCLSLHGLEQPAADVTALTHCVHR